MNQLILLCHFVVAINTLDAQVSYLEVEYSFTLNKPEGGSLTFFKKLKDNGKASVFLSKDTAVLGSDIIFLNKTKSLGLYINKVTNKLYQYEPIFNKDFYIIDDSITDKFQWIIYDTIQKTILGYNCKLATCEFRGREYKAYYCESLPFYSGPWKLTGLPGTILEAATKDGMYKYEAYKVSVNLKPEIINNPYSNDKIKFLTFIEHKKLFLKNYLISNEKYNQKKKMRTSLILLRITQLNC
ncbi:MAG: GLPGLI family protein [Chitinophagaceae bacterium]|nr:GLPGLI family protein [Chitinophagaceae bacterium]